jgi:hypothetical protein
MNNRIQKFDANGAYVEQWGTKGTADGQFNNPQGVAVDKSGNVYVADTYNQRIQKLTASAVPLSKITSALVAIKAPVTGEVPENAEKIQEATASSTYAVSNVTWNEALVDGKFKDNQVYTATIELTANSGEEFQAEPFTPVVEGAVSVGGTTTLGTGEGNKVSFTVTFHATLPSVEADAALPTITTQPKDVTVEEGQTATFTVAGTSTDGGAITYSWRYSFDGGTTWSTSSIETPSYTILNPVKLSDNGHKYKCLITNTLPNGKSESVETNAATVTVTPKAEVPTALEAPTIRGTAGDGSATITWNGVEGATGL